jgi:hypothetical protein
MFVGTATNCRLLADVTERKLLLHICGNSLPNITRIDVETRIHAAREHDQEAHLCKRICVRINLAWGTNYY